MNPEPNPNPARAARDHVIALLTRLPSSLGGGWSLDDATQPDWPAWRAAEDLSVTLRIGARELIFMHSLDLERSARLVVECRCGVVPKFSGIESYHTLLARNHQNFPNHPSIYALDSSTNTVVFITSYLLESLDADMLSHVVVDAARHAMSWQEEFAPASDPCCGEGTSPLVPRI